MLGVHSDEHFMGEAIKLAQQAALEGEIPVGAVIVHKNRIIAKAHNQTEKLTDVTAHAEILAITSASNFIGSKYLTDCTMYVTLEPCVMCAGALYWSQISKIVVGASDEKRGFMRIGNSLIHPKTELIQGVKKDECAQLITDFFKQLRK